MIKLHDIRYIVFINGFLLFVMRPLLTIISGPNVVSGVIQGEVYFFSALIGLLSFVLAVLFFRKSYAPEWEVRRDGLSISSIRYFFALFVWIIIEIYLFREKILQGTYGIFEESALEYTHGSSSFLPNSVTIIGSIFLLMANQLSFSRIIKIAIIINVLSITTLFGMITGSKSLALYPLFTLIIIYSRARGGVKVFFVISALLLYIFAQIFLDSARHLGIEKAFLDFGQYSAEIGSFQDLALVITNRFYGTDILYRIIQHHNFENAKFLLGSSLIGIPLAIIPRAFWAEKPVISFGKIVSEEYLGSDFWGTGISAAPTWIGELYANFGVLGIFIFIWCLRILSNHVKNCQLSKSQTWKREYYFPLSFTTIAFFQEASIAGWLIQLVVVAVFCVVLSAFIVVKPRANRFLV